jgi:hypothetical protein
MSCGARWAYASLWALESFDLPSPLLPLGILVFGYGGNRQLTAKPVPVAVLLLLPADHWFGLRTELSFVLSRSTLEKAKLEVTAMATGKRELIDTGTDKRYVRRDEKGQFDEVVDVGRSLSQDRKRHAENESKPGHGDRGDRKR